jgi:hypothetical protein
LTGEQDAAGEDIRLTSETMPEVDFGDTAAEGDKRDGDWTAGIGKEDDEISEETVVALAAATAVETAAEETAVETAAGTATGIAEVSIILFILGSRRLTGFLQKRGLLTAVTHQ